MEVLQNRWGHQITPKKGILILPEEVQKLGPWEGIHPTESVSLTEMQSKMLQPLNTQGGAKPTTQTPWERPLELCHWPLLWGGSTPPTTTCGRSRKLHLSALKGHAYNSLHGALLMVLTHYRRMDFLHHWEEDSFKFRGPRALKRCINQKVPRCGLLDEGYVYVRMIVALKKQNLPPEWTCSRPLPRGSSNGFIGPPPVFWMTTTPMLNPWYIQCIPVKPLTPVPLCSMAVLLFTRQSQALFIVTL